MGFRDRWFTRQTATALISWRIAVGVGVAVAMTVAGLAWPVSVVLGVAVYASLVVAAMPRRRSRQRIDPFVVGEPWRHFVQGTQRSANRVHEVIAAVDPGPLRTRLEHIAEKIDHGLDETFGIAKRGDQIDAAIARLDPTALRSKLATLEAQQSNSDDDHLDVAIASVRSQVASTDRLKEQSVKTANRLRLTQTRLEELVARASEIAIGAGDTDAYEHDVDDLVIELEALHLAIDEIGPS